jgi:hypothetical protein
MSGVVSAIRSTTGTAGATSAAVVGANPGRREITIVNDHATQVIYLQLATKRDVAPTAVVGQGIRLNAAGGSWTSNEWDGAIASIATGASTVYTIVEF